MLGPPKFRSFLLRITPWPDLHRMKRIVDVMDKTSNDIYTEKKEKLKHGDEAVVNQIGRGKDIMSVLRKLTLSSSRQLLTFSVVDL